LQKYGVVSQKSMLVMIFTNLSVSSSKLFRASVMILRHLALRAVTARRACMFSCWVIACIVSTDDTIRKKKVLGDTFHGDIGRRQQKNFTKRKSLRPCKPKCLGRIFFLGRSRL
jgi:hypothetical protein